MPHSTSLHISLHGARILWFTSRLKNWTKVSQNIANANFRLKPRGTYSFGNQLYHRGIDNQLQLCIKENEYLPILHQAHSGVGSGHFSSETTTRNILWSGLWWPTLNFDAAQFVKRCEECQRSKPPTTYDRMPLRPLMATRAFAKWGIDFIGPIKPPARGSHAEYILVADYLTKWVEAKATVKNDARTTTKFLYE